MKNLAVVLHTCDAYERLWKGWAYCWNKFQAGTELDACPRYFVTEEKPLPRPLRGRMHNINTGKGEWSDRLLRALVNIPESYVLYMQEDFWLKDTIMDQMLEIMMKHAKCGDAVRIMGSGKRLVETLENPGKPRLGVNFLGNRVEGEDLCRFRIDSPYFFGHAATIWYKPHLIRCLAPGENPWMNCWQGNERCKRMDPRPVHFHYPFEWYEEVHNNVKRTPAWKNAGGDRSLPGELSAYGHQILKEMK